MPYLSTRRPWAPAAALGVVALLANASVATEGVLEINRTCAVETGCFPGDAPTLPVTITQGGSYRLTGDLVSTSGSGSQDFDFVQISAEDVTLDMAGFRIRCAALVAGAVCTGAGNGIRSTARGTTVSNGSIRGMANDGVLLGADARVVDVTVESSGGEGVAVGPSSVVRGSISRGNGGAGFAVGSNSVVRGNAASDNGTSGFSVGTGSTVIGNSSAGNTNDGFALSGSTLDRDGGLAQSNTATDNGGFGFDNGVLSPQVPIPLSSWGLIDNVANDNNAGGDQIRGGIEMGQNVCEGDLVCP